MDPVEGLVVIVALSVCIGMPMLGLLVRFAVKPLMLSYLQAKQGAPSQEVERLKLRVEALEALAEQRLAGNPFESQTFPMSAPRRPMS